MLLIIYFKYLYTWVHIGFALQNEPLTVFRMSSLTAVSLKNKVSKVAPGSEGVAGFPGTEKNN